MNTNIRIIKRSERSAPVKAAESHAAETKNARHASRDITGHVTTWIKELQQRHTPDPRLAFANLFIDPATTSAD
ncbi:MAG TPA: hypothetical protein VEX70_08145 [Pyrinomonadaceae bacterium]|jgi:hypothetical protein|nr:hypothetical protein [Pyrinomonadaceae bacterium]